MKDPRFVGRFWKRQIKTRLVSLAKKYIIWLEQTNHSLATVKAKSNNLAKFLEWTEERSIHKPSQLHRDVIERYQGYLVRQKHQKKKPISQATIHQKMISIRTFLKWLAQRNHIPFNPANEIDPPKLEKRLPRNILTHEEAEKIINTPNIKSITGLRDRALLEVLYATGIRRMELSNLKIQDLDLTRQTIVVREGKGGKDRILPLGERATMWLDTYLEQGRNRLLLGNNCENVFLSKYGGPFSPTSISQTTLKYLRKAGIKKERIMPPISSHSSNSNARKRHRHPLLTRTPRTQKTFHNPTLHESLNS